MSNVQRKTGFNSAQQRAKNQQLILTLLREQGAKGGAEIAQVLGLSAQTVSVILRSLEHQGLVDKGEPVKGRVGKPLVPFTLAADGLRGLGLRIGRRKLEFALVNLRGDVEFTASADVEFPTPGTVDRFTRQCFDQVERRLTNEQVTGLTGMGVAVPYQLWNWLEQLGVPNDRAEAWRSLDLETQLAEVTRTVVHLENDVNYAASGELLLGNQTEQNNFAYFFFDSLVGGAVVLDGAVRFGASGNAGAFGSIPTGDLNNPNHQLIDSASIYTLERRKLAAAREAGGSTSPFRFDNSLWRLDDPDVQTWLSTAAIHTARAAVAVCATLDISSVVVDGAFPTWIREALVDEIRKQLTQVNTQGIAAPILMEGALGPKAGVLGAAYQPIIKRITA